MQSPSRGRLAIVERGSGVITVFAFLFFFFVFLVTLFHRL